MKIKFERIDDEYTALFEADFIETEQFVHWHSSDEFIYVCKGSIELSSNGKAYSLRKGDIGFVRCGEIHSISRNANTVYYIFTFKSMSVNGLAPYMKNIESHITSDMLKKVNIDIKTGDIFDELYSEISGDYQWSEEIIRADVIRLYSLLGRHFQKNTSDGGVDIRGLHTFQKALEYISENFREDISLSTIAKKINYNPAYASTMFSKYTGVGFSTYLTTIRINRATELLRNTNKKITEISSDCGYSNIRAFNKAFKRVLGTTPMDYRKSYAK